MSAGHSHALPATQNQKNLLIALVLTSTFLLAEVIGCIVTGSLALLSDAAHMLTDASAWRFPLQQSILSSIRQTPGVPMVNCGASHDTMLIVGKRSYLNQWLFFI